MSKMFILYVKQLTENYHPEGGLVIIADSLEDAKRHIETVWSDYTQITDEEWESADVYELAEDHPIKTWCFPNTGCC